ncbi:MAG: FliH/SctL family protein [Mariprofundaceae bacterium]
MHSSVLSPLPLKYIEGKVVDSPLPDLDQQQQKTGLGNDRMRQLEKMLNAAQGRAEVLERETYDKAYQAGEQAGMDLGRKRAEQMLETMQSLVKQCESNAQQWQDQADQAIMDIAESVIRHTIDTVLDEHPEHLKRMVEQAASFLPQHKSMNLAVSIQDIGLFERLLGDTPTLLSADDNIEPGTCRIMACDHDVLVDPQAAISECMQHIRARLLQSDSQQMETAQTPDIPASGQPSPSES